MRFDIGVHLPLTISEGRPTSRGSITDAKSLFRSRSPLGMATVQRLSRLDRGWITGKLRISLTHAYKIWQPTTQRSNSGLVVNGAVQLMDSARHLGSVLDCTRSSSNRDGVMQWDWGRAAAPPPHPACNVTSAFKRLPTRVNAFAVSICAKRSCLHGSANPASSSRLWEF